MHDVARITNNFETTFDSNKVFSLLCCISLPHLVDSLRVSTADIPGVTGEPGATEEEVDATQAPSGL